MTVVLRRIPALVLVLALAGLVAMLPAMVEAHAALVRSDPAVNANLSAAPRQVTLWFTEALEGSLSKIQVLSSSGEDFAEGSLSVGPDPAQMSIALRDLPPGIYSVVWTSFSSVDGHSLTGAYPFTVLEADGSVPSGTAFAGADSGSYEPPLSGSIARWLMLLAVAGLLGPGTLAVLGAAVPARWWAFIGGMLAATGALVLGEFVFRQLDTTDAGTILGTRQGLLHAAQAAAAVTAGGLAVLFSRTVAAKPGETPLLHLGLMNQAASAIPLLIALVSHTATGTGHGWLTLALAVHIWCALAWPGALGALAWQAWQRTLTAEVFQRFSLFALGSAALVLVLGVFVAVTQVPTRAGLESGYGEGLVIKTVLFAVALLLAAVNTLVLHRRLTARGVLRGLVAEAGVLVVVLLVAGRISQLPPPATDASARAAAIGPGFERTLPLGDLNGTLAIVPNIVGSNRFVVALAGGDGGEPGEILRVRLRFTPSDPALGRSEVILEPGDRNQFTAEGAFLSSAGGWTVEADVRRRGEDDVAAQYQVQVEPPRAVNTGGTWSWPVQQF
ncbi:MAG: copper resistance protein CopC/CopD, partial [Acidimicrobiales bacterium]|nr:copper resistance protein CopC/CopD [Acidimicrobiales bacterium]